MEILNLSMDEWEVARSYSMARDAGSIPAREDLRNLFLIYQQLTRLLTMRTKLIQCII